MGREKALLPWGGATLGQTVLRAVEAAAGSAVLVGNPCIGPLLGYPAIPDLYPGEGPLGGILAALASSRAEWNLVTACDMPGLSAQFLRGLLEAAERSGAAALLPAAPGEPPQPLCAVYRRSARELLGAAFDRGVRKMAEALRELRVEVLPVTEVAWFENVNTPEEWAAYARH